jgi:hypothetical protein
MMTKLAEFAIVNVAATQHHPGQSAASRATFGDGYAQPMVSRSGTLPIFGGTAVAAIFGGTAVA